MSAVSATYSPKAVALGSLERLLQIIFISPSTSPRLDDDIFDRMSHNYSVRLLMLFVIVTSAQVFMGNPITCWTPAEFHGSHVKYANSFCWVRNTYYLPWSDYVPKPTHPRKVVTYYQWVPFILFIQGMCFLFPSILWSGLNRRSGVDIDGISHATRLLNNQPEIVNTSKMSKYITLQLDRFLTGKKSYKRYAWSLDIKQCVSLFICRCCGRSRGNYLILLFTFTKLIYIANIAGQVFLLNFLLGSQYHLLGLDFVLGLIEEKYWANSTKYFPRVTMCDFNIRRLGNINRYTLQCVLPINLYSEKIFIFFWFWMLLVGLVSVYGLLRWLAFFLWPMARSNYIVGLLETADQQWKEPPSLRLQSFRKFLHQYLKCDGVFIIRLLQHNCGRLAAQEVVCALWGSYQKQLTPNKPPPAEGQTIFGEVV